jgi:hypothetical protein
MDLKNDRYHFNNKLAYKFLTSFFIILKNDITHVNCSLTLDFIKRNVHFNLYFIDQANLFFNNCRFMKLD